MHTVDCNGVSINYRTVGAGENVVLIHGLGANHAFWHLNVMLTLSRQFRVILYDLRGHGYSSMPVSGYSSADMAQDLHQLLNHLNISRVHLIGHSFGGVIGLHYAVLHPQRVASLTLVDSRVRALQPHNRPTDWPNWPSTKKKLKEIGLCVPEDEEESGLWLLDQLALPKWQRAKDKLAGSPLYIPFSKWGGGARSAERWLTLMKTTTARKEFIASDGLTVDDIATIKQPSLIICGELSSIIPSYQGLQRLLTNHRTAMISGAGHFLPITHPLDFLNLVSPFLDSSVLRERRKYERFPIKLPLIIRLGGGDRLTVESRDVSKSGLLVQGTKIIQVGAEVELLKHKNKTQMEMIRRGKVVRMAAKQETGNYRFGIQLTEDDGENSEGLYFLVTS